MIKNSNNNNNGNSNDNKYITFTASLFSKEIKVLTKSNQPRKQISVIGISKGRINAIRNKPKNTEATNLITKTNTKKETRVG